MNFGDAWYEIISVGWGVITAMAEKRNITNGLVMFVGLVGWENAVGKTPKKFSTSFLSKWVFS
jgi:hypothetical protein